MSMEYHSIGTEEALLGADVNSLTVGGDVNSRRRGTTAHGVFSPTRAPTVRMDVLWYTAAE